jgi:hypothetical protein
MSLAQTKTIRTPDPRVDWKIEDVRVISTDVRTPGDTMTMTSTPIATAPITAAPIATAPIANAEPSDSARTETPAAASTPPLSATELRGDIYRILDEILASGQPRAVHRKGRMLLIQPAEGPRRRLSELPRREGLCCSPEELIGTSWEREWQPGL